MPTGAKATPELYQRLVDFGLKHNILIINDNPYSFILTDKPLSILAAKGAFECCLELNSLSKSHNMSGWRVGMVAGDPSLVGEVLKVKSQMDSGQFKATQLAAIAALGEGPDWFVKLNEEYRHRRDAAGKIFDALGVEYGKDTAGLFLWGRVPASCKPEGNMTPGEVLSERILHSAGVFITPGFVFGKNGEDFVRISLCANVDKLKEAERRISRL
jgi:aspartate/methionine/tyrosine aminotransferase